MLPSLALLAMWEELKAEDYKKAKRSLGMKKTSVFLQIPSWRRKFPLKVDREN